MIIKKCKVEDLLPKIDSVLIPVIADEGVPNGFKLLSDQSEYIISQKPSIVTMITKYIKQNSYFYLLSRHEKIDIYMIITNKQDHDTIIRVLNSSSYLRDCIVLNPNEDINLSNKFKSELSDKFIYIQ